LSLSPHEKNAVPALAAAVMVTGVLTTAVVTLIGIVLKQSIDVRNTQLAEQAAERAATEQRRLVMETALGTVRLLGRSDDDTSTVQASAALIVLAKLGEARLAVHLAGELWPLGRLSSSAAVELAESGLTSGDHDTQYSSAMLLRNNTNRLYRSATQYEWPRSLDSWPMKLPADVRGVVAMTVREWCRVAPLRPTDWRRELVANALAVDSDPTVVGILNPLAAFSARRRGS
jgi:hypothetical protein